MKPFCHVEIEADGARAKGQALSGREPGEIIFKANYRTHLKRSWIPTDDDHI